MDVLTQWSSLILEVQKYILSKPIGTNLYVSEDVFSFFSKNLKSPVKTVPKQEFIAIQKQPLIKHSVITPPAPPLKEIIIHKPVAAHPLPDEKTSLKGPAYDYNLMKDMIGGINPDLKILDLNTLEPSCLIMGLPNNQEEKEMMENIKKAIESTLKKTVIITPEELSEADYKALFSKKNLCLSLISQELLEKNSTLKMCFKISGPIHYLGGLPALSVKTFRSLKENQEDKRILWKQIKTILDH